MKRDKLTFLIAELILIVLAAFFIHKIFQEDVAQKRVAVILQNSGDTRWCRPKRPVPINRMFFM